MLKETDTVPVLMELIVLEVRADVLSLKDFAYKQ